MIYKLVLEHRTGGCWAGTTDCKILNLFVTIIITTVFGLSAHAAPPSPRPTHPPPNPRPTRPPPTPPWHNYYVIIDLTYPPTPYVINSS